MKTKMVIGYVFGFIGLIILVLNAYVYLSRSDIIKTSPRESLIFSLLFYIIGATMIRNNKEKR